MATRRTPSLCRGSSPSSLKVPWSLLNHVVEDALLVSSRPSLKLLWFLLSHVVEVALLVSRLLWSLQFFHVVAAVLRLLLLLLNFVVDAPLVSTLLTWAHSSRVSVSPPFERLRLSIYAVIE